jgi:hypothetical protein
MAVYAAVDPVIRSWADQHEFRLSKAFGGQERRFCYVTGGPQECFQISIEPPEGSKVLVNAWSIETIDDEELHESWLVPVAEVRYALNLALDKIRAWTVRPKRPATWRQRAASGESP